MKSLKFKEILIIVIYSIMLPGLGQVYAGNIMRGVALYGIYGLTNFILLLYIVNPNIQTSVLTIFVLVVTYAILFSWIIFDAFKCVKTSNQKNLGMNISWYKKTFCIVLIILMVFIFNSFVSNSIAGYIKSNFIESYKTSSGAMSPTMMEGDHVMVDKTIYRKFDPQRGDIIVFRAPIKALVGEERVKKIEKDFIKRCVAVGGDKVEVVNKKLFINDKLVKESYLNFEDMNFYQAPKVFKTQKEYQTAWENGDFADMALDVVRDNFGPVVVPAGCYFAMGDNRDRSFDSRFWGSLPKKNIVGKTYKIYWPLNRSRRIE